VLADRRPALLFLFVIVLFCAVSSLAYAGDAPCTNAQIRAAETASAQNALNRSQDAIMRNWKSANSFNSVYCGAQLLSNFDTIGNMLSNGIYSLIQSTLNNLISQACRAAVAPIQNAASQLCIPFFTLPSLNLNLSANTGFCSGMSLLTVNPVTTRPYTGAPLNQSALPLMPY
jgi:hypothetical protein